MFDLVVSRGLVAGPDRIAVRTLCIADGRIAAVLDRGEDPVARVTIDASDRIVLPGLVDAHVHFRDPGLTHKEDFGTGSAAAAAGGVTTVMVMPTDDPLTTTPETFAGKRRLGEGRSHVDFALQAGLGADTRDVRALADLGAISFELFQTGAPLPLNVEDPAAVLACLQAVRDAGGITGITPGSSALLAHYAGLSVQRHGGSRQGFPPAWPVEAEAIGVANACHYASLSAARVHLRQVSCAKSVAALAAYGSPAVTAEVTPHNLVLDESALFRLGPVAKVAPPLRPWLDVEAVRRALRERRIDIVATDHAPHTPEEKAAGEDDIRLAPGGFPGVQTLLPLMLKLVADGVLDYPRLVQACCEQPARIFGLYPRKGALCVGSDADMVLIDPAIAMTIRDEDQLSKARRSPFHGITAPATPRMTLLRGTIVMQDGQIRGAPAGRFLAPSRS